MRRADRLFQIVQILRRGRIVTAERLTRELEISVRTVYRDMDDLARSGIPVYAEAGVGYRLLEGFELPPLMFSREELTAIEVAARMLSAWGDGNLVRAITSVLDKIGQALPKRIASARAPVPIFAPRLPLRQKLWTALAHLREATRARRKLRLEYTDRQDKPSRRVVRPLGLYYRGHASMLAAWCEAKKNFRNFRLDRIDQWTMLDQSFDIEPGKTLADYDAAMNGEFEIREDPPAPPTARTHRR